MSIANVAHNVCVQAYETHPRSGHPEYDGWQTQVLSYSITMMQDT
jgi:hypothetical protein